MGQGLAATFIPGHTGASSVASVLFAGSGTGRRTRPRFEGRTRFRPNSAVRLRRTAPAARRSHSWKAIVLARPSQRRLDHAGRRRRTSARRATRSCRSPTSNLPYAHALRMQRADDGRRTTDLHLANSRSIAPRAETPALLWLRNSARSDARRSRSFRSSTDSRAIETSFSHLRPLAGHPAGG